MNAYVVDIWSSLKHNSVSLPATTRQLVIHARNTNEATSKVILNSGYIKELPGLKIEVGKEFVYSCRKIGTVTIEKFYTYSNDAHVPIRVCDYKNYIKDKVKPKLNS